MTELNKENLQFTISVEDEEWQEHTQLKQESDTAATLNIDADQEVMHTFSNFPDSAIDDEKYDDEKYDDTDETELLKRKKNPVWSFAFYQEFFDVNTSTVLARIKGSVLPLTRYSLNKTYIKGRPDMYGPFWICATLVICIGVFGNLTNLFSNLTNSDYHYKPQFQMLPIAATIVYSYTFIFPLLVRVIFYWRRDAVGSSVSQLICIYGYSLFLIIPATFLFIVPYNTFDWAVLCVVALLSGIVLVIALWPAFENDSKKLAVLVVLILFGIHVTVIVFLKYCFFHPFSISNSNNTLITYPVKTINTILSSTTSTRTTTV